MTRDIYKPHKPTKPNGKRRARFHNYRLAGFYMLTMVVADRRPLLGRLKTEPEPHIDYSVLGKAIRYTETGKITEVYPMAEVWRVCIMPDHIHIIIQLTEDMPEGKTLGDVVRGFKSGCNRAYWQICRTQGVGLFERGYNDRLLYEGAQLDRWKHYLKDNPRRLAVKRAHPDYFTVLHEVEMFGETCTIVGNRFLLDIPDKEVVIVHRADDDSTYAKNFARWMACGERGGVLVSAAIAPREKTVMREAMNRGYDIILLRENGFPPNYKPTGESFDTCAAGQLLQISPWPYHNQQQTITRQQCLYLNALAERISQNI